MNYQEYIVKVFDNGDKHWYRNDKRHRLDGPAVEYHNGDKVWYKNDKHHRFDGPAKEYANGDRQWYIEGKYIACSSQEEFLVAIAPKQPACESKIVEIDGVKYKLTAL